MSYTPINWQTGDTITAEKMNKMDNGWGVQETELFSETVTTEAGQYGNMAVLDYSDSSCPESMAITYDNTEYTCARQGNDSPYFYGAPDPSDFSTYPFVLLCGLGGADVWTLITSTAGSHTVAASGEITAISDGFIEAGASAASHYLDVINYEPTVVYFGTCRYRNSQAISLQAGASNTYYFTFYNASDNWYNCSSFVIGGIDKAGLFAQLASSPSGSNNITVTLYNPTSAAITASANEVTLTILGLGAPAFVEEMQLCTPSGGWS